MAKGGRYLNTNKKDKKKGKGLKVFIIILVILGLLIGGGYFAFRSFMGSMLGNVQRAEYEEKNQDKSADDLLADIYGGMDLSGMAADPAEEEGDEYVPEDTQASEEAEGSDSETVPAEE